MRTIAVVALLIVGAAPSEKEKLQGPWFATVYTTDGEVLTTASSGVKPDMVLDGDKLVLYGHSAGTYKLGETKYHTTIDFRYVGIFGGYKTERGIYKLEGDTLTICSADEPAPRPDVFTAPAGSKRKLYVYSRKPVTPNP